MEMIKQNELKISMKNGVLHNNFNDSREDLEMGLTCMSTRPAITISLVIEANYRSQYARINTRLFSFVCTRPILWNRLPNTLKNTYTLASFKRNLKNILINASSLVG